MAYTNHKQVGGAASRNHQSTHCLIQQHRSS